MDHDGQPTWERRFRAPNLTMPDWSPLAPDRIVYESTESGIWQAHAWDRTGGARRQVSAHPVGVVTSSVTLDGSEVLYWQDETGDESGRWYVQEFHGSDPRIFLPDLPEGWNEGLAQAAGIVAAGISSADGFAIYVAADGQPAKEVARSTEYLVVSGTDGGGFNRSGLSADGTLLSLTHSEHGDQLHPGLRVIDPRTGAAVGDLLHPGKALQGGPWSPVPGDQRVAVIHERTGIEMPALWNPVTGEWTDLATGLDGDVNVMSWWPDATALLLCHLQKGRYRLHRFELSTGALTAIEHPEGQISGASVRPDGRVWYRHASGAHAPRIMDDTGAEVLVPKGERAPEGRPYVSWEFTNPRGQTVHGFYVTPEGTGPFPILMHPHGGPTWLDEDRWSPEVQSYVDAGFVVAMVNYRGSTGFGAEWRDALVGDVGGPELEDLNAALADLVARGIADPDRAAVGGWSWGGYLTLMEFVKHPELWKAGIAGVPVGDYEMSYADMSPDLQAYDRALLGGAPSDVPELMRDRNPIYFTDNVTAPVLFVIGENDSRCPIRQAMAFVDKLKARSHPVEVHLFPTGHSSFDLDEDVDQQRTILDFLARTMGVGPPA